MKEQWKIVPSVRGVYKVSSWGRIERVGTIQGLGPHKCGSISSHGYRRSSVDGKRVYVHRLVAEAFIPNPENKPQVNHIDGDKLNNRVANLEWCTARENLLHRSRVLGKEIGANHHESKLTPELVSLIRNWFSEGLSNTDIEKRVPVSRSTIWSLRKGKTWFHVPAEAEHA